MTFPRFHLSTLLLLCVFCGACVGVWLTPPEWERYFELHVPDPKTADEGFALAFNPASTLLFAQDIASRRLIELPAKKIVWSSQNQYLTHAIHARFARNDDCIQSATFPLRDGVLLDCYSSRDGALREVLYESMGQLDSGYSLPVQFAGESVGLTPDGANVLMHTGTWGNAALVLKAGDPIANLGYSFDGCYLAAGGGGNLIVWRRTRDYGWRGYPALPLFWIAALSFAGLIVIFIRHVLRRGVRSLGVAG